MSIVQPTPTDEFVCDLNAFTPEQREHHLAHAQALFGAALAVCELPDGYAVHVSDAPDMLEQLADFIAHERMCCPFLAFGVDVEAHGGPIWLRITGAAGVKQPLEADLLSRLNPEVAAAAGLR